MRRAGIPSLMLACVFSAFFLISARGARAVLGGPADSVEKDMSAIKATRRAVKSMPGYTVHEMASGALTLREYVSPDGIVFGIAWNGLLNPDLNHFLGAYYGQYHEAKRQMPRVHGRRSIRVRTNGLVVERWGHMRSLHGRAYVPALLPEGVNAAEIR